MASNAIILDANWQPIGYEQITDLSSAIGLKFKGRAALIQAEGDNIRWRDDGVAPMADIGMILATGSDIFYTGDLSKIQFIQSTSNGVLNVSYYETPRKQV